MNKLVGKLAFRYKAKLEVTILEGDFFKKKNSFASTNHLDERSAER